MHSKAVIPVLALSVAALGCNTITMREDSASPPEIDAATTYATQVAIGGCAFGPGKEALAAITGGR